NVTGVQTCALPICLIEADAPTSSPSTRSPTTSSCSPWTHQLTLALKAQLEAIRSLRQWPSSTGTEALAMDQGRSRFGVDATQASSSCTKPSARLQQAGSDERATQRNLRRSLLSRAGKSRVCRTARA